MSDIDLISHIKNITVDLDTIDDLGKSGNPVGEIVLLDFLELAYKRGKDIILTIDGEEIGIAKFSEHGEIVIDSR